MLLEDKIIELLSYLDTLNCVSGDSPCVHMAWYRTGNNRRNTAIKKGSSFLKLSCSVSIAFNDNFKDTDNFMFKHFNHSSTNPIETIDNILIKVKEYIKETNKIRKNSH